MNISGVINLFEQNRGKKFKLGFFDCAKFTRDALRVLHGKEIFPDFPNWENDKEALKIYVRYGGISLILKAYGFEEIGINYCTTGDIIVIMDDEPHSLCFCINNSLFHFEPEEGLEVKTFDQLREKSKFKCFRLKRDNVYGSW